MTNAQRSRFAASLLLSGFVAACGGAGGAKGGGSGGSASGGASASGGSGSGGSGSGGKAVGSGGSASGGSSSGGSSASGGSGSGGSGSGGASSSGGSTSSGGSGTGGAPSTGGSSSGGGVGGGGGKGGGSAGTGGAGGATMALHGGASAKFICDPNATYPASPLAGMGAITMIKPDNTTTPNYFAFVEGPVWIGSLGTLFFSDNVSPERIWKLLPGMSPQVLKEMSGSNGMAIDGDDKLIVTDQEMKRIYRLDPASPGSVTVVVPAGNFKPNDVIVRSDGNIYFTDPDTGFYWYSKAGKLTGPMKQVNRPNGIELSLDENTLIVGDVGNKQIHTMTLAADGTVMTDTDKLFVTAMKDTVDGMCTDCAGNLYAATSGGIEVYSPTAQYIGTVMTGDTSNCTFGGADRKTMYTASRSAIQSVTLGIPGLPD
ncbi:MAG TPA: SMP-30/gluconolactonase/LRE family protein [Polyangia bacterium]|jgi:gluconolactonase